MMTTAPVILAYAAHDVTAPRSRRWRLLWAATLLPAAVAPFLTFSWSTSPLDVLRMDLFDSGGETGLVCAALGFLIVYPLSMWRIRMALVRPPGVVERPLMMPLALLCNAPLLIILMLGMPQLFSDGTRHDYTVMLMIVAGIAAGVVVAMLCRRTSPSASIDALMLGGYITNALLCLLEFSENVGTGYWLTVVSCAMMIPQLVLLPQAAQRRLYAG
jgi:hypothetical protein